jgi:hypothetical protein
LDQYDQLTPDSGCKPILFPIESRVIGVGPQIGYIFPTGHDMQGYINLKAYGEFDNANQPDGWNGAARSAPGCSTHTNSQNGPSAGPHLP